MAQNSEVLRKVFLNALVLPPNWNIAIMRFPVRVRVPGGKPGGLCGVLRCGPFTAESFIQFFQTSQRQWGHRAVPVIFVRIWQVSFHLIKIISFLLRLKRKPRPGHCVPFNLLQARRVADQPFSGYSSVHVVFCFPHHPTLQGFCLMN